MPKNRLIKGNLTLTILILLIFSSSILLLSYKQLTIFYKYSLITTYKLVLAILISPLILKVVTAVNSVIVNAFSGILLTYYYSSLL